MTATSPSSKPRRFDDLELAAFRRDGFLVARSLADPALREAMDEAVERALDPPLGPVEFEADVGYPGAPSTKTARGGHTPRRLLHAYTRDERFREWARYAPVVERLAQLMDGAAVCLSQNHHNCVMTKYPGFSSLTNWHQDIRYWSFDRPELVSVWLALGREHPDNGGLSLIPGSHNLNFARGRLDAGLFLRTDLAENRELIESAVPVVLEPGDVLFFHCRLFHAAGRNRTRTIKKSVVFTYRAADNAPIPNTRSAVYEDIGVG